MKPTDRCFHAAFKRSRFDDINEYTLYCKNIEKAYEMSVPKIGNENQWKNFIYNCHVDNYDVDYIIDKFKEFCKTEQIIIDSGLDLSYKSHILRMKTRYYKNLSLQEYYLIFKEIIDLKEYIEKTYNKTYDNFYHQIFRYLHSNGLEGKKKDYYNRFIYLPELAKNIFGREMDIHNILSGYGQVKYKFDNVEEYLYHLKNCEDFENYLIDNDIDYNERTIRNWVLAGKPNYDDFLNNKISLNKKIYIESEEIQNILNDILIMKDNNYVLSDNLKNIDKNSHIPGTYIRLINGIPVDICQTIDIGSEIEYAEYMMDNVLDWIYGMDYEDVENFHKQSVYNIKKFICYKQYGNTLENKLLLESNNKTQRETIEFLVANKLNIKYFSSGEFGIYAKYDWKEALKNIYGNITITSHNTQRPSSNVINSDLKNNIQMGCLLGDFDSGASALIFDKDVSAMSKPEIKGRGFIKSGKEIYEFQSYWTEKDKDFIKKNTLLPNSLENKIISTGNGPENIKNGSEINENNLNINQKNIVTEEKINERKFPSNNIDYTKNDNDSINTNKSNKENIGNNDSNNNNNNKSKEHNGLNITTKLKNDSYENISSDEIKKNIAEIENKNNDILPTVLTDNLTDKEYTEIDTEEIIKLMNNINNPTNIKNNEEKKHYEEITIEEILKNMSEQSFEEDSNYNKAINKDNKTIKFNKSQNNDDSSNDIINNNSKIKINNSNNLSIKIKNNTHHDDINIVNNNDNNGKTVENKIKFN